MCPVNSMARDCIVNNGIVIVHATLFQETIGITLIGAARTRVIDINMECKCHCIAHTIGVYNLLAICGGMGINIYSAFIYR